MQSHKPSMAHQPWFPPLYIVNWQLGPYQWNQNPLRFQCRTRECGKTCGGVQVGQAQWDDTWAMAGEEDCWFNFTSWCVIARSRAVLSRNMWSGIECRGWGWASCRTKMNEIIIRKAELNGFLHSKTDTGEPVFLPFRMSCFVISNLVVTAGMLTPGLQVHSPPPPLPHLPFLL